MSIARSEEHPPMGATESDRVRFVPLGGLGEIGMNCFALEQDGAVLVVDCGVTFPEDDVGVDVLHADFSWLCQNEREIVGIFITHAHEDHIGALPYLLAQLRTKPRVFAPPHSCAVLAGRLEERSLDPSVLVEVQPNQVQPVGPFSVEPVAVSHSIVDATALCIETVAGYIVHTGDFNLDPHQVAGWVTDDERLEQLGRRGVRALLSDSTNVDSQVRRGSEGEVASALERLVTDAPGRVIVGMFSSNIHRLVALGEIAERTGRKICFLGRSLERQVAAATQIGRLRYPSDALVGREQLEDMDRKQVLVVAGGSQAEGASSLRRLSLGAHQYLALSPGDRVILSSRIIPGNERPVLRMINDLLRQEIDVRTSRSDPDVHTSGHAGAEELRQMIRWLRPQSFIPVHGTLHHLLAHQRLARSEGVADTAVVENGTSVEISRSGSLRRGERVPHGVVRVAMGGGVLDEATRKRRIELGRAGAAFVTVALNERGEVARGPEVQTLGIPGLDDDAKRLDLIARDVAAAVRRYKKRAMLPLEEVVRRAVRRTIVELTGIRPPIEVCVLRSEYSSP